MKNNYKKIVIALVLISALFLGFISNRKNAEDPEKKQILLEMIAFVMEKLHYEAVPLDDTFSKGVYKDYIQALDPSKRFLLQSDIDEFSKYETYIDDELKTQNLQFFYLTYNRLKTRMEEAKLIYKDILNKPFDFTIDEEFSVDYEKAPFTKNKEELIEKWRKQLKLSVLSSITDKIKMQEASLNNDSSKDEKKEVSISDEDQTILPEENMLYSNDNEKKENTKNLTIKTFDEIEKESRASSLKSLDEYFGFINDLNEMDWFTVYINAIVSRFDPHTSYFAPEDKDKFDISMSGKLEGIGAKLQKKNDFTEISELISGGPAWRNRELEAGDIIMKVGQGKEEPVDVIGMRLDDVVKKIKGPKGTEVRLTVKKVDGSIKVISIIRDIVELEETYLKSSIVDKGGKKYGIINLPKFYIDFEDQNNRDAGRDVAIELERLKKEGVQGIIMDLRDNGGGSLRTVVDLTRLFVNEGPVVQVKSAGKNKEILADTKSTLKWDGPLVVIVNEFSASASEIFAAAIQDYKRGIIIGSKHTYGKGTVQSVIDLNKFLRNNSLGDFGALKVTTQKFYRINGGSTQLKGVSSDIAIPDRYSYIDVGERDLDNPMPWDKIDPAPFKKSNNIINFDAIVDNSKNRVAESEQFKLIDQNAKWISKRREENSYQLNYEKFRTEMKKNEDESKKYKAISDYKNEFVYESLPYELDLIEKDSILGKKRERWHESLTKDPYIEEGLNILQDLFTNSDKKVTKIKDTKITRAIMQ